VLRALDRVSDAEPFEAWNRRIEAEQLTGQIAQ